MSKRTDLAITNAWLSIERALSTRLDVRAQIPKASASRKQNLFDKERNSSPQVQTLKVVL